MNKINFVIFGKIKETSLKDLINEYVKRLSKYAQTSLTILDDEKISDENNQKMIDKALQLEANKALKIIKDSDYLIILDLHGKNFDTIKFTEKFKSILDENSSIVVLVGSSYGLDDSLRKRANLALKLSDMTFTHPITLLLILEQVFRSFKILNNETYHK